MENTLSILVFSAAGQSSSCGSTGGRIEARRHERWRVKGSQAGRGVQGGKRDDSIISQNRTIHELSCTLYRRHREVSDVTTVPCLDRTPRNNHIRGARDYSAGRGSRGNWHTLPPGPTVPGFAPLQSADVLPHFLHLRFLRFLEALSGPRSPLPRLTLLLRLCLLLALPRTLVLSSFAPLPLHHRGRGAGPSDEEASSPARGGTFVARLTTHDSRQPPHTKAHFVGLGETTRLPLLMPSSGLSKCSVRT